jgi:hypothetical protein
MFSRVAISVEGQTEKEFCDAILNPFFATCEIVPVIIGTGRAENGKKYKGGGRISINEIAKEVKYLIHNYDCVTTMYDYYGLRNDDNKTVEELEEQLNSLIGNIYPRRFIPYIQKHEFETLLFANSRICAKKIGCPRLESDIQKVIDSFGGNIEKINNSKQTAPSIRLKSFSKKYGVKYEKLYHSRLIVKEIGLEALRLASKHFNAWIDKILEYNNRR